MVRVGRTDGCGQASEVVHWGDCMDEMARGAAIEINADDGNTRGFAAGAIADIKVDAVRLRRASTPLLAGAAAPPAPAFADDVLLCNHRHKDTWIEVVINKIMGGATPQG